MADILISRLSSQGCKFLAVVNYITASASRKREPNDSKFRCPAAVAAPGTSTLFPRDTERHVNRNSSEPSSKVQNVALSTGQKCAILILDDSSGYFVRKTIGLISRKKKRMCDSVIARVSPRLLDSEVSEWMGKRCCPSVLLWLLLCYARSGTLSLALVLRCSPLSKQQS